MPCSRCIGDTSMSFATSTSWSRTEGGVRVDAEQADVILRLKICHRLLRQATGALVLSILTRNALNSGVCVLASPTEGVSVLAP